MKSKSTKPRLSPQIVDEASEWFVDFRLGDVNEAERGRFDEWLRRSPEHIRAYMEIAKTYVVLPTLDPGRKVDVEQLIAYARSEGNVVPLGLANHRAQASSGQPDSRPRGRSKIRARTLQRLLLPVGAAMAAIIAGVCAWNLYRYPTYKTDTGEQRSITLADGSIVDLNARSKIRVELLQDRREVNLLEGQAFFEIAQDKSRPFIVRSGRLNVRVVGTQFDVNQRRSATTVTVLQGRVVVLPTQSGQTQGKSTDLSGAGGNPAQEPKRNASVLVSAGEQVVVTGATVPAPKRANIQAATAWLERRLVFDGSRLADVAEDFNRYNSRQIVIADPRLEDFHISGIYSSTDPASLIRFLQSQPGVEVVVTDASVRVERK
jgi:transmembrane sensor